MLVHQFEHIGSYVMVQGGSKVNKDIPPYILVAHDPIAFAGINIIGLRRRGFTPSQVEGIQNAYRILYGRGLNVSQALEVIESEMQQTPERDAIVSFVRSSERGVVRERSVKDMA